MFATAMLSDNLLQAVEENAAFAEAVRQFIIDRLADIVTAPRSQILAARTISAASKFTPLLKPAECQHILGLAAKQISQPTMPLPAVLDIFTAIIDLCNVLSDTQTSPYLSGLYIGGRHCMHLAWHWHSYGCIDLAALILLMHPD